MSQSLLSALHIAPLLLLAACDQQSLPATIAVPATTPASAPPVSQPTSTTSTTQPGPDNRTALLMLSPYVAQLAKAPALQADARVQQLSQQLLTEATVLEQAPATASLQPTLRTLASVLQAAQQKAYPTLATPTQQLVADAQKLSGQPTPAEQAQYTQFFTQASNLLKQFIAQTPGAHR